MGAIHYIVRDFGFIHTRGQPPIFFKKGYVHNVSDDIANNYYFKMNEDPSRLEAVKAIAVSSKSKAGISEAEVLAKLEEQRAAEQEPTSPVQRVPIGQMMADRVGLQPPPPRDKPQELRPVPPNATLARKVPEHAPKPVARKK